MRILSRFAVAVLPVLLLAGCAGFFVSDNALVSLAITPSSPTILVNGTQQFTANGTYGDGSVKDATSQVTWSSSSPTIATITSAGLATGVALGSTKITATSGSVNASATLTVSNRTISSISILPANPTMISGQVQQFTATATYSDGSTTDVTSTATWTSSNTTVATISSTGQVTAVSAGTSTITASSGSVSATSTVTVQF